MDDLRKLQEKYVQDVANELQLSLSALAVKIGLSASALTRFISGKGGKLLSYSTMASLNKVSGLPLPTISGEKPNINNLDIDKLADILAVIDNHHSLRHENIKKKAIALNIMYNYYLQHPEATRNHIIEILDISNKMNQPSNLTHI